MSRQLNAFTCTITPFDDTGALDEGAWEAMLRRIGGTGMGVYAGSASPGEGHSLTLAETETSDIVVVHLDGSYVEGSLAPTSELDLHLGVYADRPEAGAVVHTHAPYSTAVACVLCCRRSSSSLMAS